MGAIAARRYAVIGNPVLDSLSPAIHRAFARTTQRDVAYCALAAKDEADFTNAAAGFFASGGRGLNVTAPFKAAALRFADSASANAQKAGAANVLRLCSDGEKIAAANTDGAGFIADMRRNLGIAIAAKTILLIGAGGAARGIIGALIANAPAAIQIVNRTPAKAQTLAAAFAADCAVEIASGGMGEARPAQIVINAAAAGFAGEAPPLSPAVFKQCEIAYDLSYGAAAKPFMALAKQSGAARVCDGLGMLAEQAALSFALWEKVKPATRGIIAALRADL